MFQSFFFKRGNTNGITFQFIATRAKNHFRPCHAILSIYICRLPLVVHLVDARDLFLSILTATFLPCSSSASWKVCMTFFTRKVVLSSFFLLSSTLGAKVAGFPQAVRDSRFRGAVSRLLLVWPTARSTFLPPYIDPNRSRRRKSTGGWEKKMTDFIFSECTTVLLYAARVSVRSVANTFRFGEVTDKSKTRALV